MSNNQLSLVQVDGEAIDAIKFIYQCQINEQEREKFSEYPASSHKVEYKEELFQRFLANIKNRINKEFIYFVLKRNDDKFLGFIQLSEYNERNRSIEMGFYFPKENRFQGYGKKMIDMFLSEVFADEHYLNLNKIYGETCELNSPSKKLFENFGFNQDGVMREHYWFGEEKYNQLIYSLLKEDYQHTSDSIL